MLITINITSIILFLVGGGCLLCSAATLLQSCSNNFDCPEDKYCSKIGYCDSCTKCWLYNRNVSAMACPTHPQQCGPCLQGYTERQLTKGELLTFCDVVDEVRGDIPPRDEFRVGVLRFKDLLHIVIPLLIFLTLLIAVIANGLHTMFGGDRNKYGAYKNISRISPASELPPEDSNNPPPQNPYYFGGRSETSLLHENVSSCPPIPHDFEHSFSTAENPGPQNHYGDFEHPAKGLIRQPPQNLHFKTSETPIAYANIPIRPTLPFGDGGPSCTPEIPTSHERHVGSRSFREPDENSSSTPDLTAQGTQNVDPIEREHLENPGPARSGTDHQEGTLPSHQIPNTDRSITTQNNQHVSLSMTIYNQPRSDRSSRAHRYRQNNRTYCSYPSSTSSESSRGNPEASIIINNTQNMTAGLPMTNQVEREHHSTLSNQDETSSTESEMHEEPTEPHDSTQSDLTEYTTCSASNDYENDNDESTPISTATDHPHLSQDISSESHIFDVDEVEASRPAMHAR